MNINFTIPWQWFQNLGWMGLGCFVGPVLLIVGFMVVYLHYYRKRY